MKKIYIVTQEKDSESSLEALREFGMVHVEHQATPKGETIDRLRERIKPLQRIIGLLSQEKKNGEQVELTDWESKLKEIAGLYDLIDQYREGTSRRRMQITQWEPWGDFNPGDVEALEKNGVYVRFVEIAENELNQFPADTAVEVIFVKDKIARCVVVSMKPMDLPGQVLALPHVSLSTLKQVQERNLKRIDEAQQKIRENVKYLDAFKHAFLELEEELIFDETRAGKGLAGQFVYLKGFCPAERSLDLQALARRKHWAISIEDPSDEDKVPTLIRNPKWVGLIRPVFQLMNILPGYREKDISPFFLIFLSMFSGILIGDAGYGLFVFLVTMFFHVFSGKKVKEKTGFHFLYLVSFCTILWGILTGTFFGQKWIPSETIHPLIPWLNDAVHMQTLCFFIGSFHLSIAHAWRLIMKIPSPAALSEIGWLMMIWGIFFLARTLVLSLPLLAFVWPMVFTGMGLVVFFTSPKKNPLKAIGPGLGNLALNAVNTFSDVISYIRLFAVGLATVAVADACNDIVLDKVGFSNFFLGSFSVIILIIGHLVLNIILGALAVLVHGIRLNVLEFSGHLSLEWVGSAYKPFRKLK